MEAQRRAGTVVVGGHARQQFHDARGYGRPLEGNEIELAPVEAAHLLFRGDLAAVDGQGFAGYVEAAQSGADGSFAARFLAYADLRRRGFYLAPAREGWVAPDVPTDGADFIVFARGAGPPDGEVAHRLRTLGEREDLPATALGEVALAIVDEEGEVSYFETDRPAMTGGTDVEPPAAEGALLADRVVSWAPPEALYTRGFYGQPLTGRELEGPLQLSLVEAAYLARADALAVPGGADAVVDRGRAVEGERFDRRLAAYTALRDRGLVPKTGFKFGADFRVYTDVSSVDDLGHSAFLVRVVPPEHVFPPRELALDVRLAGGVRKRMVFACTAGDAVEFLEVGRLTP